MSSILLLNEEPNSTTWTNDFDYKFVEINETDEVEVPTTEKTQETLIVLEKDGNETKIFESPKDEFLEIIAPPDLSNSSQLPDGNGHVGNVPKEDESTREFLSTTPKILVYSPTIPQIITTRRNNRVDVTTNRYNRSEGKIIRPLCITVNRKLGASYYFVFSFCIYEIIQPWVVDDPFN